MQPQRRSIRLRGYDYTQPGAYFVTVCCDQRQCVLGEILADGALCPSPLGLVVHDVWKTIPDHFPSVRLGPFVVMPNHIHGILFFLNEVGAKHASPLR
ncbi:MAG TPA: hypothetical protein VFI11_07970, partial [Anaerolineales bacterium]|nr:hypothetical protein [Anaerolineales bacterium]